MYSEQNDLPVADQMKRYGLFGVKLMDHFRSRFVFRVIIQALDSKAKGKTILGHGRKGGGGGAVVKFQDNDIRLTFLHVGNKEIQVDVGK